MPEATDAVARDGENGLQKVGGAGEIGSAMGQVGDCTRETHEHKVTDTRCRPSDPVQSDGNAVGRVPDEQRRALGHGWRDEKRQRDQQSGECGSPRLCAPRTISGDRFWTTP